MRSLYPKPFGLHAAAIGDTPMEYLPLSPKDRDRMTRSTVSRNYEMLGALLSRGPSSGRPLC